MKIVELASVVLGAVGVKRRKKRVVKYPPAKIRALTIERGCGMAKHVDPEVRAKWKRA